MIARRCVRVVRVVRAFPALSHFNWARVLLAMTIGRQAHVRMEPELGQEYDIRLGGSFRPSGSPMTHYTIRYNFK
jgi:hypothetical protein